jgi:hypothetical protein
MSNPTERALHVICIMLRVALTNPQEAKEIRTNARPHQLG